MRDLAFCIGATFLLRLGNSATGVLLSLLLAHLHRVHPESADIGATTVGLLAAAFYFPELLGAPLMGALSDQYGRKLFMVAGPIFGIVAVQLIGWLGLVVAMAAGMV